MATSVRCGCGRFETVDLLAHWFGDGTYCKEQQICVGWVVNNVDIVKGWAEWHGLTFHKNVGIENTWLIDIPHSEIMNTIPKRYSFPTSADTSVMALQWPIWCTGLWWCGHLLFLSSGLKDQNMSSAPLCEVLLSADAVQMQCEMVHSVISTIRRRRAS